MKKKTAKEKKEIALKAWATRRKLARKRLREAEKRKVRILKNKAGIETERVARFAKQDQAKKDFKMAVTILIQGADDIPSLMRSVGEQIAAKMDAIDMVNKGRVRYG